IEQAVVAGGLFVRVGSELRNCEKSENTEAIVHAHNQYASLGQHPAILPWLGGCPCHESSTMNPNHDRQFGFGVLRGRPDIQRQAVFAASGIAKYHIGIDWSLHAPRPEFRGAADSIPIGRRRGSLPAKFTDRGSSVWNSQKRAYLPARLAFDRAGVDFHPR